jgi:hypothetical protein
MKRPFWMLLITIACLGTLACQTRERKRAELERQYREAEARYATDCDAVLRGGTTDALSGRQRPPVNKEQKDAFMKKCDAESKRASALLNQLRQLQK